MTHGSDPGIPVAGHSSNGPSGSKQDTGDKKGHQRDQKMPEKAKVEHDLYTSLAQEVEGILSPRVLDAGGGTATEMATKLKDFRYMLADAFHAMWSF